MRFTAALTVAAMAGVSAAHGSIEHPKNGTAPAYVTEVVTAYTTYCPEPTEITHAGETYTVSEATTLTILDCSCTVTKPATSAPTVPATVAPVYTNGTTAAPTTVAPIVGTGTAAPTVSAPLSTFTGAANKAASGAGVAAVFGLAAYLL